MKYRKRLLWMVLILFLLIAWLLWGNRALMTTQVEIRDEDIPDVFDGYCIAHISDLHNAEFGKDNSKLLDTLAAVDPDIIVFTGDMIDSHRPDMEVTLHFAKEAAKIAPTYFATGNHEAIISEYELLKKGLCSCGVTVLENEGVILERSEEKLALYGLEDPGFAVTRGNSPNALSAVETNLEELRRGDELYSILLAHRPEFFEQYAQDSFDLILSGHAHGGQIRIPFLGALIAPGQGFFPQYHAGVYEKEDAQMVVSRGLGNSSFPLRVNNRPEIVLVYLKKSEKCSLTLDFAKKEPGLS